jgi:hypothetical protein
MKLSYYDLLGDQKRHTINAEITTDHPSSSYNQPVIVLDDGGALSMQSWVLLGYQVEEITKKEARLMKKWLDLMALMITGSQSKREYTIAEATEHATENGHQITDRGLRKAAKNGYVPGAYKIGRDWIIPEDGLDDYLNNRPKPGRK